MNTLCKVIKSDLAVLKDLLVVSASDSRPNGVTKGLLLLSAAATVNAANRRFRFVPKKMRRTANLGRDTGRGMQVGASCLDAHRWAT